MPRPCTVLQDRNYVRLEKRALIPEDRGRIVTAFLESFFAKLVEYGFTADLEEKLDEISAGELRWKDVLRDFWIDFTRQIDEIKDLRVSEVLDALNDLLADHIFPAKADGSDPRRCPTCGTGQLSLKLGKFGAFIGCSNYPECRHTMQLSDAATGGGEARRATAISASIPTAGFDVLLEVGPLRPLCAARRRRRAQALVPAPRLDPGRADARAARCSCWRCPARSGRIRKPGSTITAGIGRYGPFVLHDGKYANLPDVEEVFTVGAQPRRRPAGRRRPPAASGAAAARRSPRSRRSSTPTARSPCAPAATGPTSTRARSTRRCPRR